MNHLGWLAHGHCLDFGHGNATRRSPLVQSPTLGSLVGVSVLPEPLPLFYADAIHWLEPKLRARSRRVLAQEVLPEAHGPLADRCRGSLPPVPDDAEDEAQDEGDAGQEDEEAPDPGVVDVGQEFGHGQRLDRGGGDVNGGGSTADYRHGSMILK